MCDSVFFSFFLIFRKRGIRIEETLLKPTWWRFYSTHSNHLSLLFRSNIGLTILCYEIMDFFTFLSWWTPLVSFKAEIFYFKLPTPSIHTLPKIVWNILFINYYGFPSLEFFGVFNKSKCYMRIGNRWFWKIRQNGVTCTISHILRLNLCISFHWRNKIWIPLSNELPRKKHIWGYWVCIIVHELICHLVKRESLWAWWRSKMFWKFIRRQWFIIFL